MKKIITALLSMSMIFACFSVPAMASSDIPPQGGETIVFDEENYAGMSLEEAGVQKLRETGYSENLISSMPIENLIKIGSSPKAQQATSYYMEMQTENETYDLMSISEDTYETAVEAEMQAQADEFARTITVVDENGNVISSPENTPAPLVTESLDGGKVSVVTTLYQVTDGALSQYLVVSEYAWATPPKYRGTDYFGITRDSNCSMVPGTFGNTTYYKEYRYFYLATNAGVQSALNSTNDYSSDNLANQDSASQGFVIKVGMPVDVNPPPTMLVGSSFLSRNYANMQGGVWYQGVLKQPSLIPQNFNHFGTYYHQKSTTWGSVSLTVPLGASFTLDKKANYSTPVEDVILVKWDRA